MKNDMIKIVLAIVTLWGSLSRGAAGFASDKLPVMNGKEIVATVDKEPITLEEFNRGLASLHEQMGDYKKSGVVDYSDPLKRLINTKLILLEARNIGIDTLPEVQKSVESFSKQTLMELLMDKQTKDLRPDEKEVDRLYKEEIKEYNVQSIKLEKEKDAARIEKEIKAGHDSDTVIQEAISKGIASGSAAGEYLKSKDLIPQIAKEISKMDVGSVSPVIPIQKGFVIMKLKGILFPEDPEAKARIEETVLRQQKTVAMKAYVESLKKKYVKIDQTAVDKLDFEAKTPGFEALLKDTYVLAEIEGEAPVTVGDVAQGVLEKFFHGVEKAIGKGKLNRQKDVVLHNILGSRVVKKEALKQGIDQTDVYKNLVEEYRTSVIFGKFIEKVVVPDMRIGEKDINQYYQGHQAEFSTPPMMRIRSLIFAKKEDAEKALQKLKTGTDFKWMSVNADGQVGSKAEGLLKFEGDLLMISSFPEDVQKTVSGAHSGEFRIYQSTDGRFYYVLFIQEVVPQKPQPLDEAREEIKKGVFKEKLKQSLNDWGEKLRKYYPVKIYIKDLKNKSNP